MTRLNHLLHGNSPPTLLLGLLAIALISACPDSQSQDKPVDRTDKTQTNKKKTNKKKTNKKKTDKKKTDKKKTGSIKSLAARPLPLEQARQRARLVHDIYESTLLTMHRHYFEPNKQRVIPSRALEDVFYTARRRWGIEARWLAVSAQAMNIDHKPKTAFEKTAVRLLATGKKQHEEVREGTYRMAAPIVLFANCIRCHTTRNRNPVAGLVLSLPIKSE